MKVHDAGIILQGGNGEAAVYERNKRGRHAREWRGSCAERAVSRQRAARWQREEKDGDPGTEIKSRKPMWTATPSWSIDRVTATK